MTKPNTNQAIDCLDICKRKSSITGMRSMLIARDTVMALTRIFRRLGE
jgi:hypothetical protein